MSALFVEFISILVDTTMYFNYDFGFIFFNISTQYDHELVEWNIWEVRQASKSLTGNLCKSLEIVRWIVNTLLLEITTVISKL